MANYRSLRTAKMAKAFSLSFHKSLTNLTGFRGVCVCIRVCVCVCVIKVIGRQIAKASSLYGSEIEP